MSLFRLRRRDRDEASASQRRRRRRGIGQGCLYGLETLETRLAPAVSVWSGAANDGLWSTPANWSQLPSDGDSLSSPAGATSLTNTNDLTPGTTFAAIDIGDAGYVIGG